MAEHFRDMGGGKYEKVNGPDRRDSKVEVDPSLMREGEQAKIVEAFRREQDERIALSVQQIENAAREVEEIGSFEEFRDREMAKFRQGDQTQFWKSAHGPTEDDWLTAHEGLSHVIAKGTEAVQIARLIHNALSMEMPGKDGLAAAIDVLERQRQGLEAVHEARRVKLWEIYEQVQADPQNGSLIDIYGQKREEALQEEQELARLAKAKEAVEKKRASRTDLFEPS
jgi:hypothetical protein